MGLTRGSVLTTFASLADIVGGNQGRSRILTSKCFVRRGSRVKKLFEGKRERVCFPLASITSRETLHVMTHCLLKRKLGDFCFISIKNVLTPRFISSMFVCTSQVRGTKIWRKREGVG